MAAARKPPPGRKAPPPREEEAEEVDVSPPRQTVGQYPIPEGMMLIPEHAFQAALAAAGRGYENDGKKDAEHFLGLSQGADHLSKALGSALQQGIEANKRVMEIQDLLHRKDLELADWHRKDAASAQERERQQHDLRMKQLDVEAARSKYQQLISFIQPVLAGAAGIAMRVGVAKLDSMGLGPGGPVPSPPAGAPTEDPSVVDMPPEPAIQPSLAHIGKWRECLVATLNELKPETVAQLRAIVAGLFQRSSPPPPAVSSMLMAISNDSPELAQALLSLTIVGHAAGP